MKWNRRVFTARYGRPLAKGRRAAFECREDGLRRERARRSHAQDKLFSSVRSRAAMYSIEVAEVGRA